jgi:HlyD family secretion protein
VEATDVRVATKVAGRIDAMAVREGDRVVPGQEIVRLDTTDTRLALDAARAEQGQAEADLALRESGSRPEEIAEAKASAARARAELNGAERDLERMRGLLERGSGTEKARDDAQTRRDMADGAWRAAEERARRLEAGFRREEKDAARARVAAAKAKVAQLEQQVADAVITSPSAGTVTEKLAEQGELAARGQALVVVTDLADAWLTTYVSEPDLARVRLGQDVEVKTDDGQLRSGRIIFLSPQAEFTPKNVQTPDERAKLVFKMKVQLPNGDGLFKPGMPAQVKIVPGGGQ